MHVLKNLSVSSFNTKKNHSSVANTFLGAFAKLRKATISFVMSVDSTPSGRIFIKFYIQVFSEISQENPSLIKTRQV
jgi:hypothetical protein